MGAHELNNRLQPTQIGLGTSGTDSSTLKLDYEYTSSCQTGNNGNVLKQTITAPGLSLTQNYCYDSLNRLLSASENNGANWSQSYGYDRFGNRWVSASPGFTLSGLTPTSSGAFNTANNRLFASGYDSAGNQTGDALSRQFTYDAENRQLTFNTTGGHYFYDGDGHRVKKVTGSVTTIFVYNVSGQLTAEYTNDTTPPVGEGGTSYLTTDHLGSTRVVTKSDGSVKARYDYLPFGEELGSGIGGRTTVMGYSAADSTKQKFTQKERDNESGLDYFGARYYSSSQSRFASVDPIIMKKARLVDPQRLNLYAYGRSNPLKYVDPNGADIMLAKDLNQKGHEKDRKYVVDNLARLYMTEKGRAYLERADKSQFNIEIGKGTLERNKIGGEKPGVTTFGGSEHVTGGLTTAQRATNPKTGTETLMASGPAMTQGLNLPPITVTIDKDNAAAMGKDPANVFAHEIGGHVAGMLNFAERPSADNPENPSFDLTGRDVKKEEDAARKAENVGKLPNEPSPEAIKSVEELLKKRNPD